jgi:hypothetical protein
MSQSQLIESPKQEAAELLAGLPDSASWDDIEYAIYVRRKIREGREAVRRGEYVSAEEARRILEATKT